MRVLALTTLFPSGARPGFGGFVERSLARLGAVPGVELTVVVPNGVPPWPLSRHPTYRALVELPLAETWGGMSVHRPRFPLIPGVGWRLNPALIARAAEPFVAGADVIHADFFTPCGVAAAMLGARGGVPVSIKARGSDIHLWGARGAARRAMLRAAASAGGLLAVSAALKADMVALGMPANKIAVHYTGVDLDVFQPVDRAAMRARMGWPAPLVVSIGNLIPLKGHEIVMRAVAKLPGVYLRIVGRGSDEARLRALIDELGVVDRVQLMGGLPHGEVARLLAAAHVMALASEREGLANAWVEALACGTPVVATRVGGAAEVIDRAAAGRLAERTVDGFANAIAALLADPPTQADVCAAVVDRFGWARHTAQLHAHLMGVAGRLTAAQPSLNPPDNHPHSAPSPGHRRPSAS